MNCYNEPIPPPKKRRARHPTFKLKRCKYCKTKENLTKDHKVPLVQGGKDEIKNLQCLCKPCNQMKSGMSDKQVLNFFKWAARVNRDRIERGCKPYE